ncbi:hypothetical protein LS684_01165 [Cytobacillus spongiae]|uniref:hypothetical protein n=1 Tax=Cytobacillus spongiae TaxID=2901381 RepID=UPI001F3B3773|nr:hypothetical protein [Cytobacillus spongiae]UII56143.1 hypothetical protein LS684_01165 [Cytobacillus spongiae]
MEYQQKDFTLELKNRIKSLEIELNEFIEKVIVEYQPTFRKRNMVVCGGVDIEGEDPFLPGYCSSISIGFTDKSGELLDLHLIKIWNCGHTLWGIPISIKIPGGKVVGELVDEPFEEVKMELKEYIAGLLFDKQ